MLPVFRACSERKLLAQGKWSEVLSQLFRKYDQVSWLHFLMPDIETAVYQNCILTYFGCIYRHFRLMHSIVWLCGLYSMLNQDSYTHVSNSHTEGYRGHPCMTSCRPPCSPHLSALQLQLFQDMGCKCCTVWLTTISLAIQMSSWF